MRNKIVYGLVGLFLLAGWYACLERTIDGATLALIERARTVDSQKIWPGFDFSSYPIEVTYGKKAFLYREGKIEERENSLGIEALSAIPSEEGPLVLMMPLDRVRQVVDIGGDRKEERDKIYLSILLHEAFHCYQMDQGVGASAIKDQMVDHSSEEYKAYASFEEAQDRLDQNKTYQKLWQEEARALKIFRESGQGEAWLGANRQRLEFEKKTLGKDFPSYHRMALEKELLEGTARYVEEKTLAQVGQKAGGQDLGFIPGQEKFYTMGYGKSLVLDRYGDWKKLSFDGSISLDQLLMERVGSYEGKDIAS